jgi:hypothetical protein
MNHCLLKIFRVPIDNRVLFRRLISHTQVSLGTAGWKERFYKEKFSAKTCVRFEGPFFVSFLRTHFLHFYHFFIHIFKLSLHRLERRIDPNQP